jgi:uncharacterized protein YggU (UPF0235/DUF167 family)
MAGGDLPLHPRKAGVSMPVRVKPGSAHDRVEGVTQTAHGAALQVRVRAAAERGKANDALEKTVARWLGLARTRVSVAQGGKSRSKMVAMQGDPHALEALIRQRVAALR